MTTVQDIQRTVVHFVEGRRKRRQLRRELDQLAAMGCLDAALADAGLVRSQVEPLIAGCADSGELLEQMLARLDIDAARLPVDNLRDMTWACTTCPDKRQCRRWLSGRGEADFHAFCPNAAQLDEALAKQHPDRAPPVADAARGSDGGPSADDLRRMRAEISRREVRALLDGTHLL